MMDKTTNKFSPENRARAVRMVLDHESERTSRWAAATSIAGKIGCSTHSPMEWVRKAGVEAGRAPGVPAEVAAKLKALERENRELRQANEILRIRPARAAFHDFIGGVHTDVHKVIVKDRADGDHHRC